YAIMSDAGFNTVLKSFNPTTGAVLAPVFSPGGFSLADMALNDRGELWVADSKFDAPGLFAFRAGPDTLIAGPLDTGLPPSQLAFDHTTGEASVPLAHPIHVLLSAPRPNPSRGTVRC